MVLRGNFSGLICSTDPVKVSKDTASLFICTRKKFFAGGCVFFLSNVINGGLLGHLGPTETLEMSATQASPNVAEVLCQSK